MHRIRLPYVRILIDVTIAQSRGVGLFITHLKKAPRESFERAGIIKLLGEDAICKDIASAMVRVEKLARERAGPQTY